MAAPNPADFGAVAVGPNPADFGAVAVSPTAPNMESVASTPLGPKDVPESAPTGSVKNAPRTGAVDFLRGLPGALSAMGINTLGQLAGRATALLNPSAGLKVADTLSYTPSEKGQETGRILGKVLDKSKLAGMGPMAMPAGEGATIAMKGPSSPLQAAGRSLMQSALKPSKIEQRTGKAGRAVDTMLEGGYSVTKGGVEKMTAEIDRLNDAIKDAIKNSPATVDKAAATKALNEAVDKFKLQVTPQADLATIQKAMDDFMANPLFEGMERIPVQLAQDVKQGTYRVLGDKAYGEQKGAGAEAQKALARGLKEGVAEAVPSVGPMNAKESDLINARNIAANRVMSDANKNPIGLGILNPSTLIPWLMDRSPAVKSLLARGLYQTGKAVPDPQVPVPSPQALQALGVAPLVQGQQQ